MIFPNMNIFIVYSVKDSDKVDILVKIINRISKTYAVSVSYINDDNIYIDGAITLIDLLDNKVDKSNGAIILYTGEVKQNRAYVPRANIIFEMGMLFKSLPKNRILIINNKAADMFSDISGIIRLDIGQKRQIKDFSNEAEIEESLIKFIGSNFLKKENNPLQQLEYKPDYLDFSEKGYFESDDFIEQIKKLSTLEEKIIFLAERIQFTGIIRSICHELRHIIGKLNKDTDDETCKKCLMVLQKVLVYLETTQKRRLDDDKDKYINNYEDLRNNWTELIDWFSKRDINPLIKMICYDYAGLTNHKILQKYIRDNNSDTQRVIEDTRNYYIESLKYMVDVDIEPFSWWEGHIKFDFARLLVLEYKWLMSKVSEDLTRIKLELEKNYQRALYIRRDWYDKVNQNTYKNFLRDIRTELQCEYFYAQIDYINEMRDFINEEQYIRLKSELVEDYNGWKKDTHDLIYNIDKCLNEIETRH